MHTITTATLAAASIAAQDRANATGAAWVFFSSGYGNGCYERADDLTGTCTVRCQRWHNGRLVVVVQPEAVELTARAKAFSGEAVRDHRFRIETDGTLRVWDTIAGHYTACHGLRPAAVRRIRKLAAR